MLMDDWDLHAVVRGCCTSSASTSSTTIATPTINTTTCGGGGGVDFAWFPPLDLVQEDERINAFSSFSSSISNHFESRTGALEDLEQLCKPFLPSPPVNLTNPTTVTASSSAAPPSLLQNPKSEFTRRSVTSPTPSSSTSTARPKRRKNQQKKVVCQVPAEGLSSDMWAWRKYGQKPIKGSPYPRGYYRCSSSKGCLARKQVERSRSDPSMFIITYTAEHNHPVPTHRNSLAGSTRNKVSTSAQRATTSDGATTTTTTNTTTTSKPSCSSSSPLTGLSPSTGLSPTTPLSIEEDQLLPQKEEGEEIDQDDDGDDLLHIPEGCDDMFMDFEEFNESTGAPPSATNPTTTADQFQANFSWITS